MDKCISGFQRFHAANLERERERERGRWLEGPKVADQMAAVDLDHEHSQGRVAGSLWSLRKSLAAVRFLEVQRLTNDLSDDVLSEVSSGLHIRRYMRCHSYVTSTHHRYTDNSLSARQHPDCFMLLRVHARPGKPALRLSWVVLKNLETSLNCLCVPGKLGFCHTLFSKWSFFNSK